MFKVGDKVKVVKNADKRLPSYIGKRGKVTGSVTELSCRVKLVGSGEYWFSNEELDRDK